MPMKVRYVGPDPEGVHTGEGQHFPQGEEVEVPNEVGESLVAQGTFEKVGRKTPEGKGSAATARSGEDVETR